MPGVRSEERWFEKMRRLAMPFIPEWAPVSLKELIEEGPRILRILTDVPVGKVSRVR